MPRMRLISSAEALTKRPMGVTNGGTSGEDFLRVFGRNVSAGVGVEDDSDGIRAGVCRGGGVLGTADTADFYPGSRHGKIIIEKPWTRNWREIMAAAHFLAFDIGAESGRAILGTLDGANLSLAEKHRFANPNGKMLGRLQWNLLAQWEEVKAGLRKTSADLRGELAGIGVDTWGVDFGLIGVGGEILANPTMYRDPCTDGVMERTFAKMPREAIFQSTGIQFMQINTLFQLIAMRERKSELLETAQTMLFMPDLLNYLLCGSRKSELSIASTSQMYDPRLRRWATEMLEKLEIPTRILPEIVASGTVLGNLREDVAAECGAKSSPVIAPGCHDTASAVAAVPVELGEDWCYISSGTWSLMGVELKEPIVSDKAIKYNYTNEMGVGPCVRFLKNIMGLWLVQECRRYWQKQGNDHGYNELTEMAGRAAAFGPLIDPAHAAVSDAGGYGRKDRQVLLPDDATQAGHARGICPDLSGKPGADLSANDRGVGGYPGAEDQGHSHRRRRDEKRVAESDDGRCVRANGRCRPGGGDGDRKRAGAGDGGGAGEITGGGAGDRAGEF